jgi:hypothetical protein
LSSNSDQQQQRRAIIGYACSILLSLTYWPYTNANNRVVYLSFGAFGQIQSSKFSLSGSVRKFVLCCAVLPGGLRVSALTHQTTKQTVLNPDNFMVFTLRGPAGQQQERWRAIGHTTVTCSSTACCALVPPPTKCDTQKNLLISNCRLVMMHLSI